MIFFDFKMNNLKIVDSFFGVGVVNLELLLFYKRI